MKYSVFTDGGGVVVEDVDLHVAHDYLTGERMARGWTAVGCVTISNPEELQAAVRERGAISSGARPVAEVREGEVVASRIPSDYTGPLYISPSNDRCGVDPISSGACERGTSGCVRQHEATPADMQIYNEIAASYFDSAEQPALQMGDEQVRAYVDNYELRSNEGSYTPSEHERLLLLDAISALTVNGVEDLVPWVLPASAVASAGPDVTAAGSAGAARARTRADAHSLESEVGHSPAGILRTFADIANGLIHNAHFSHAPVVMVSNEHYAALATPDEGSTIEGDDDVSPHEESSAPVDTALAVGDLIYALSMWKQTTPQTALRAWAVLLSACRSMAQIEPTSNKEAVGALAGVLKRQQRRAGRWTRGESSSGAQSGTAPVGRAVAAQDSGPNPAYSADEIAAACMAAEISDSQYESLLLALEVAR
jgi:hypothetical protein